MKTDRKVKAATNSDTIKTIKETPGSAVKSRSKSNGKHMPGPYEHAPIGIVESSLDGKYLNVNREFCRILGYERDELLNRDIKIFTYEEDYLTDLDRYEELCRGEIPFYRFEKRFVRKNGEIIWAELTRSAVRNAKGKLLYIVSTVLDVSERRKIEAQAQWQARLLAELGDAVLVTDANGNFTSVNKAAEGIYGWKEEEILGKNATDILQTDVLGTTREYATEQVAKTGNFFGEVTQLRKDGTRITLEAKTIGVRDNDGNLIGYISVNRDITDRKRTEETLRENQQRFSATFEYAPIGIVEVSLDGKYLNVNEEFCRIVDYKKEELIGHGFKGITHEEDYAIDIRLHQKLVAGEIPFFKLEKRYIRKDGTTIWAEITRLLVCDVLGKPLYTICTILDISERKQVESVLRDSVERLRIATSAARMFMWEWDLRKQIYKADENFEKILGFSGGLLPEDTAEAVQRLMPPDDQHVLTAALTKATAHHDDQFFVQLRMIDPENGQIAWLEWNAKIVYDDEGNAVRLFGVTQNITERKRVEGQLAREQELLERLFQAIPVMLTVYEPSTKVVRLNSQFQRLIGWSSEEAAGISLMEQCYPDPVYREQVQQFMDACAPDAWMDIHMRTREGPTLDTSWSNIRLSNDVQVGIGIDITDRKRTERALLESARQKEALYQLADQLHRANSLNDVFDASLDAILGALQCDRASILLYDNTEVMHFVAWRGLSDAYRKATDGHSPWTPDVKDPEPIYMNDVDTADLSDPLKEVIKREGIGSLAFIPLVSNGKLIGKFMAYFNAPHVFSHEEVDLSLTIAHQLTFGVERTRTEETLRRERELLMRLFETMPVMISIYDPVTDLPRFNAQFEKLIGWKPEEVTFASLMEACYPDPEYRQYVAQTLAAADENEWIGVQMQTRDGRMLETTWSNMRFSNGMNVGVGIDVTERRQAEKRLILLSEISELVRTLEDPNELIYAVSKAVGEHLQVKRCLFNEIDLEHDLEIVHRDYCRGVESVAGVHKVTDYSSVTSAEMMAGRTVVNSDSKTDPRTAADYERSYVQYGERAYVAVPMMREHRWVASLWVSDDQPRRWNPEEVSLLEAVAERTWTVVEKLKIAEELRAKEAELEAIITQTPFMLTRCTRDLRYRFVSRAYAEMIGRTPEEVAGKPIVEIMGEEGFRTISPYIEQVLQGHQIEYEEQVSFQGVGKPFLRVVYTPDRDEEGDIIGWFASIVDITDRKRSEMQLRESEERYRTIVDTANEGIWYVDLNTETIYLNEPMANLLGYAVDEVVGRKVPEFCFEEDKPKVQARILSNYQGNYEHFDFRFRRKDGGAVLVLASTSPVRDIAGQIIGALGMFVDVTKRKRAEERLLESEERLRAMFTQAGVGVCLLDVNYTIQQVNPKFCEIVGYDESELLGRPSLELTYEADKAENMRALKELLAGEQETVSFEKRYVHKNVSLVWVRINIAKIFDANGSVNQLVSIVEDITERKRAEEKLRSSEDRLRLAVAAGNIGIWDIDLRRRDRIWTKEGKAIYGLREDEFLDYERQLGLIHPEDRRRVHETVTAFRDEGTLKQLNVEHRIIRPDGSLRWVDVRGEAIYEDGTLPVRLIGTIVDITERKRTEEALRASETLYRTIARSIPNGGVYVVDKDLRYLVADGIVTDAFGLSREGLEGHTVPELFRGESAEKLTEHLQRAMAGEINSFETIRNGRVYWSQFAPLVNSIGQVIVVTLDITERKQAEEALRESEERFRAILRQATAGIVRKDATGKFIYVNEAFCHMLGYKEADLLGKTVWEFMHPDDVAENRRSFDRLMKEGAPVKLERRYLRADGSVIWMDASIAPIMTPTGRPQSAVAVEVDITGRKQAEESLQQLNLELESRVERRTIELQAANQALQESHERLRILSQRLVEVQEDERRALARELHDRVGQTLAALNINLIIINGQLSEDIRQAIGSRMKDSMQLTSEAIALIRSVMTDLRPAVLDDYGLEAALESYLDVFKNRYNLKVRFDHPDHPIPRLGPSVEMTFLRIGQEALMNVARHAQASEVVVSLQQRKDAVSLAVQDNGTGIESWQDANRPGSHGLTIMRERAEAFGGNLKVKSVPGQGTTVQVAIPIPDQSPAQKQEQS